MHKAFTWILCVLVFILMGGLILSGCSDSNGSSTIDNNLNSSTITAEDNNNLMRLVIPANTVPAETTFTFEQIPEMELPAGAVGTGMEIGPDGIEFENPVTLTVFYDPHNLPPEVNPEDLVLGVVINGEWVILDTEHDTENSCLTAEISHLSIYGIINPSELDNYRVVELSPVDDAYVSIREDYDTLERLVSLTGGEERLLVSDYDDTYKDYSYFKFDLSGIPDSASVISACLQLYINWYDNNDGRFGIYEVMENWSEDDDDRLISFAPTPSGHASTSIQGFRTIFITNLVRKWYNGETSNYGLALAQADVLDYSEGEGLMAEFRSKENGNQSGKPTLKIGYIE